MIASPVSRYVVYYLVADLAACDMVGHVIQRHQYYMFPGIAANVLCCTLMRSQYRCSYSRNIYIHKSRINFIWCWSDRSGAAYGEHTSDFHRRGSHNPDLVSVSLICLSIDINVIHRFN